MPPHEPDEVMRQKAVIGLGVLEAVPGPALGTELPFPRGPGGATLERFQAQLEGSRRGEAATRRDLVHDVAQSVKTTGSGGPRGYDAGKKVKGRKRQVMVDTDGRGLVLEPQPADVEFRDGL